jgi:hypothetical protein
MGGGGQGGGQKVFLRVKFFDSFLKLNLKNI